MLKQLTSVLVASTLFFSVLPADAALNAYLYLKGQKSGQIKGSVTQKGREDSIMVIAYEHELKSPVDAKSGQATGRRQHGVFKITKEIDKSTPQLLSAWVNGETLTEFTLRFWTPRVGGAIGGGGTEYQHFTVKLTNARIVGVRSYMQNNKNPDLQRYAEAEEITFAYQKIEWTWMDGGITAADDWAAP